VLKRALEFLNADRSQKPEVSKVKKSTYANLGKLKLI
jgi:hypothetical protein